VVALSIAFPPTLFLPPEVEPGRLQAPPAPGAPARADNPDRPHDAGALPERQAALPVAPPPAVEAAPGIDPFAPPPTPAVFGADAAIAVPAMPVLEPGALQPGLGRPANGDASTARWPALPGAAPALAGLPEAETAPGMAALAPLPTPAMSSDAAAVPLATPATARQRSNPDRPGAATGLSPVAALPGRPAIEATAGMADIGALPLPMLFDGGAAGSPSLATPPRE
jgi:hypothetical protein